MSEDLFTTSFWLFISLATPVVLALTYLLRVNYLLNVVPLDVKKLSSPPWTKEELKKTYNDLSSHPVDYTGKIPPRLDRRYIVTGGNGKKSISVPFRLSTANTCLVFSKGLSEVSLSFNCWLGVHPLSIYALSMFGKQSATIWLQARPQKLNIFLPIFVPCRRSRLHSINLGILRYLISLSVSFTPPPSYLPRTGLATYTGFPKPSTLKALKM